MHPIRRLLFFTVFVFTGQLAGQSVPVSEVVYEGAGVELPGRATISLAQTRDGFLWAGVYGYGLLRHEGKGGSPFALAAAGVSNVDRIVADRRGHLWVQGNNQGQPYTVRYSSVPLTGGVLADTVEWRERAGALPLPSTGVADISADTHGQVWVVTDSLLQVYRWVGDTTLAVVSADSMLLGFRYHRGLSVLPTPDGSVWISLVDRALYRLELPPGTASINLLDSIPAKPNQTPVLSAIDGAGRLWGHVNNTLLMRADPRTHRYDLLPLGVNTRTVRMLDPQTVMVPTTGRGLMLYDAATGQQFRTIGQEEGLPSGTLFDAAVSREGNLWLAAIDGVYRLPADLSAFTHYTGQVLGSKPPLLRETSINNVNTGIRIGDPEGKRDTVTLAGLVDGLLIVPREGEAFTIGEEDGLPIKTVMGAVQDSSGGIYLTSLRNGIAYLRRGGRPLPNAKYSAPLPALGPGYFVDQLRAPDSFNPYLLRLRGERKARIWLGRSRSLTTFTDAGEWVDIQLPIAEGSRYPKGIFLDKDGHLHVVGQLNWVRSRRPFTREVFASLLIPKNRSDTYVNYTVPASDTLFERVAFRHGGKEPATLLAYQMIDNRLWITVDSQLLVINPATAAVERSVTFREPTHLGRALADGGDRVWVGTEGGLYAIRKADLSIAHHFLREHGLLSSANWSPNGLAADTRGWVYQGTSEGLQVIRPQLHVADTARRPVYLTGLAYGENVWGRNELNVEYTLLSYRDDPGTLRYQTRLAGYDDGWSAWRSDNSLRYTNLSAYLWPRTYDMQVRATDYLGNVYETEAGAYPVTVRAPLYLRWWAVLVYFTLLALAIRAYTRYRLRQQERDLRLREADTIREQRDEIARKNAENETLLKEIHHRVKNNLETVSSLLELQSSTLEEGGALDAMRAGQSRVASMGLLHQKLYQGHDLAKVNMQEYLSELSQSLSETYDINEQVFISVDVPAGLSLDVDRAVPVGLIVNELMTNSLKYAFPATARDGENADWPDSEIRINLRRNGEETILTVADNGGGKPATGSARGTGFGTRLVQLLTRQLDGRLQEVNAHGLRTEIIF